jgi:lipoprotein signal peptidase
VKPLTLVSVALIGIGLYLAYTKDASFQSIDMGSLLIGGGIGSVVGSML